VPCLMRTLPADCAGLMPTPSFVIMALVCAGTLNSSATYFSTAVKGASSGTETTRKGSFGSEVRVTLKVTFGDASTPLLLLLQLLLLLLLLAMLFMLTRSYHQEIQSTSCQIGYRVNFLECEASKHLV